MKKLLFILAFAFIGQQAFAQIYIVTTASYTVAGCNNDQLTLIKIEPSGNESYSCITKDVRYGAMGQLTQELNSVINQGYKLIKITNPSLDSDGGLGGGITFSGGNSINDGTVWYFAIPWTSSGLEEVPATLKSFIINPNPANTFVDISLDYSLKGESEVVFISEAGYIAHKENINSISKNEKYNIDISKIPAGKYLVTIVNGKTYTTPQKLIIF